MDIVFKKKNLNLCMFNAHCERVKRERFSDFFLDVYGTDAVNRVQDVCLVSGE